jgi:hypothetical protein
MKILKIFFPVIIMTLVMASCDFTDTINTDEVDIEKVFTSLENTEKVLLSAYSRNSSFIVETARLADNLRITSDNRGQGVFVHSWSYSADDNFLNIWGNKYFIVRVCNEVLTNIDNLTIDESDDAQVTYRNQLKGEALALRAMAHFDLVRVFAKPYKDGTSNLGVPYIKTLDPTGQPARNTIGEVYTEVLADIGQAQSLITENEVDRFGTLAVEALLARVKLYMGNYQEAAAHATSVIQNGPDLADSLGYVKMFNDESSSETILKIVTTVNDGRIGDNFWESSTGDNFFTITDDLINLYEDGDVRKGVVYRTEAGRTPDEEIVNKYPGKGSPAVPGLNDIKVFRMSEMYLIRAEARQKSGAGGALDDLNAVRGARGASIGSESGTALEDAIQIERRKELAYEGHRWCDLVRLGKSIVRGADCASGQCTLLASDHRTVLPIPTTETFANKNMVQNEGY